MQAPRRLLWRAGGTVRNLRSWTCTKHSITRHHNLLVFILTTLASIYRPKVKSSIAVETSVRGREGFYGLRSWNCPDILHREIQQPAAGLIYLHSRPHISTRSIGMFGLPILDLGHDYNLQPRSCLQILHQKTEQLKAVFLMLSALTSIHCRERSQSGLVELGLAWMLDVRPTLKRITSDGISE